MSATTTTTTGWRTRPRTGPAVLALLWAFALALPVTASAVVPLKIGSGGPRVGAVQKALGLPADRIFGPSTARAVRRFQRRRGIAADGIVGPATWTLITRTRARQRGRRAPTRAGRVALLQRELRLPPDGVFGPATARAVRRYQRSRGMTADAIVGPATWAALGHPRIRVILRRARSRRLPAGAMPLRVRRVIAAGDRIARKPYRYGGGHGRWRDSGYDCSGSLSYALHGGGLLSAALDSSGFMRWGRSGRGRWITIYAAPGHAYMVVNGRRFDTTGHAQTGSRWQRTARSAAGYVVRHPPGL